MQDEADSRSGPTITRPSPSATSTTSSIGTAPRASSKAGTAKSAGNGPSSPSLRRGGDGVDEDYKRSFSDGEMVTQVLTIPNRIPGMNDLEEWRGKVSANRRWNKYNSEKQQWEGYIVLQCRLQKIQPFDTEETPVWFGFKFIEASRRRDPGNFAGGGMKFVFDALQKAKIIVNDGWKHVASPMSIVWTTGPKHALVVHMTGVIAQVRR